MKDEPKTILEWTYEPATYFEAPIQLTYVDGEILVQDGNAKGTFGASHYEKKEFRDAAHKLLQARFWLSKYKCIGHLNCQLRQ